MSVIHFLPRIASWRNLYDKKSPSPIREEGDNIQDLIAQIQSHNNGFQRGPPRKKISYWSEDDRSISEIQRQTFSPTDHITACFVSLLHNLQAHQSSFWHQTESPEDKQRGARVCNLVAAADHLRLQRWLRPGETPAGDQEAGGIPAVTAPGIILYHYFNNPFNACAVCDRSSICSGMTAILKSLEGTEGTLDINEP